SPLVGQKITLTFDIENRGDKPITGVSVGADDLATSGFEPFSSQAYKEIGDIPGNGKRTVSMSFKVGQNAAEGLNALTLGCKFTDSKANKQSVTSTAYILDVINDSNSKPKIIVSDFGVGDEELKASSTFPFNFTLKNTHTTKAAKNIKVTISQADNIFSAAKGTNTFYIDRMNSGEEIQNSIDLKVKSDVKTGAYELEVKLEYEYDNMSKTDQEAGGVTETNKLKLQAVENIRTDIQNVQVSMDGDMAYANQSNTLSFNIINMGKSALENVTFSIEGDFKLESGNSSYYGTLQPGTPEMYEVQVIPQTSGMCSGTIVMKFENSNGDLEEYRHEFSDIMVGEMPEGGDFMGGDMYDPGMPSFNPEEQADVKKDILPVWAFVLIQVAILVIFIPVVRMIMIKAYKKKHEDDEGL
ncbi:MAG: hypothetical protein PUC65_12340, partial [Clostridiales bacterium]|nr:hypothetical protein [Clostridiales bacterium]